MTRDEFPHPDTPDATPDTTWVDDLLGEHALRAATAPLPGDEPRVSIATLAWSPDFNRLARSASVWDGDTEVHVIDVADVDWTGDVPTMVGAWRRVLDGEVALSPQFPWGTPTLDALRRRSPIAGREAAPRRDAPI